ncbi:MAG: Crp/Fnr family transcriptional regulator [Pseudomonadota bacterium]
MGSKITSATSSAASSAPHVRQWHELLKTGLWYVALPEALQNALLDMAACKNLQSGQYLMRRGDISKGIYAILEGNIRASTITGPADKSSELILLDLQPGHWFGEITLFDHRPRTYDCRAVGLTRLLYINPDDLEQLLELQPQYWRDFGRLMAGKLRANLQATEELMCLPARARLASRLLEIASGFGWMAMPRALQPGHQLKVSQADLALMLGYSRQTVNNLLVELQDKSWLTLRRGVIEILDPAALQREARGLDAADAGQPAIRPA